METNTSAKRPVSSSTALAWWMGAALLYPILLVTVYFVALEPLDLLDMWFHTEWVTTALLALGAGFGGFLLGTAALRTGCPRGVWMVAAAWWAALTASFVVFVVTTFSRDGGPGMGGLLLSVLAAPTGGTVGVCLGLLRRPGRGRSNKRIEPMAQDTLT